MPRAILADLRRLDPRLDIHWDYGRERWKVMEWVPQWNAWTFCFFWEGPPPGREFRPLTSSEPLLRQLREDDWSKYKGRDASTVTAEINGEHATARHEYLAARRAKQSEAGREYAADLFERSVGVRQTFGPGGPRKRGGILAGSDNHRRFWQEMRKTP